MDPNQSIESLSFFSRIFFFWVNPILKLAQTKDVEQKDLIFKPMVHEFPEEYFLRSKSLFKTIVKSNKYLFFGCLSLAAIQTIVMLSNPYIIQIAIKWIDEKRDGKIWLIFLITVIKIFEFTIFPIMMFSFDYLGMKIEFSLSPYIIKKALKFPLLRSKDYDTGKIVNFLQIDMPLIRNLLSNIGMVLFVPIPIALGIVIMYVNIGNAFVAGLGVMILSGIFNYIIGVLNNMWQDQLMKNRDTRLKYTNEVLTGIRFIKFNALENFFAKRLQKARLDEMKYILRDIILGFFSILFLWSSPMLVTTATFGMHILQGEVLTASQAYTIISAFQVLSWTLRMLPTSIADSINAYRSVKRIQEFLLTPDKVDKVLIKKKEKGSKSKTILEIKDGNYEWETLDKALTSKEKKSKEKLEKKLEKEKKKSEKSNSKSKSQDLLKIDPIVDPLLPIGINQSDSIISLNRSDLAISQIDIPQTEESKIFKLKSLNMKIEKGELIALVGKVGQGKTSILQSILGEMKGQIGCIDLYDELIYVPQKPWLMSSTVKDNITFGMEFNNRRYLDSLKYSALEKDLEVLSFGDQTILGERGVNLSGGQKARISLARALYCDREIYFLDDVFAAVDPPIGRFLFFEGVKNYLREKTRIIITHNFHFLPHVDKIYVFEDGEIVSKGTYDELKNEKNFLEIFGMEKENIEDYDEKANEDNVIYQYYKDKIEIEKKKQENSEKFNKDSIDKRINLIGLDNSPLKEQEKSLDQPLLESLLKENVDSENDPEIKLDDYDPQMLSEDRKYGKVTMSVYLLYFKRCGGLLFMIFSLFLMTLFAFSQFGSNWWMSYWIDSKDQNNSIFYLKVYAILALLFGFTCGLRAFTLAIGNYFCSKKIHDIIVNKILKAPLTEFYERVPIGYILNRMTKDLLNVDTVLPYYIGSLMVTSFSTIRDIAVCAYILKYWTILVLLFGTILSVYIMRYYLKANREITRIESISRTPILAMVGEILDGLPIIRG